MLLRADGPSSRPVPVRVGTVRVGTVRCETSGQGAGVKIAVSTESVSVEVLEALKPK